MRHYTAEDRADAVALAASVGPMRAADQLGIPRRTVNYWAHKPEHSQVMRAAEAKIADRLESAASLALDAVVQGLRDGKARLGDRARALEVLATQANLASGRATVRSENTNLNLTEYERTLDAMDPVTFRAMLAQTDALAGQSPVDSILAALRLLTDEQRAELESRIEEAERPPTWDETPGTGIYGMLPDGTEMYFAEDDERWHTGEIVRRFDWRRGPSGRLTDGS